MGMKSVNYLQSRLHEATRKASYTLTGANLVSAHYNPKLEHCI
jgi:hypothetical protein